MALEIERRFLLRTIPAVLATLEKKELVQGYLDLDPDSVKRVRITDGTQAFYTEKGRRVNGAAREDERGISIDQAQALLAQCDKNHVLEKTRHLYHATDGKLWEIDVFHGKLEGVVIAEVELDTIDEAIVMPDFITTGTEVTHDNSFNNSALVAADRDTVMAHIRKVMA